MIFRPHHIASHSTSRSMYMPSKRSRDNSLEVRLCCVTSRTVICCAFALVNKGRGLPVIAAGCMDGSVRLAYCGSSHGHLTQKNLEVGPDI